MQSLFPAFFVFLFISSMNIPRNLIEVTWFRDAATANPVSYLLECVRSLIITGWDAEALALGFGIATASTVVALAASTLGAAGQDGALMRTLAVARGVAWRTLHNVFTNPSLLIPSLVFPLFFFTAFAGGLSSIRHVPGFDYPSGYTAFQFVFVLLQSAAFGGRLHRLRDRARLRERLRPPAAAGGAEPERDRARLRAGRARALARSRRRC